MKWEDHFTYQRERETETMTEARLETVDVINRQRRSMNTPMLRDLCVLVCVCVYM